MLWYKKKNIVHAGIPRHDSDWIKFVYNKFALNNLEIFDSFVFIVGKPASSLLFPIERKKKALKDIYDVVCVKNKLKLIVKSHPKESLDGIDGDIYRDVLGLENYGKNWMYSDHHPFILGKKSDFCISFKGGVPLDMLAIGKPTIEFFDLHGVDFYDNNNSLRDEYGNPESPFRYTNLVLEANTKSDLEKHVESILNKYEATTSLLHSNYKQIFEPFDGASKTVSNDILKRINL